MNDNDRIGQTTLCEYYVIMRRQKKYFLVFCIELLSLN